MSLLRIDREKCKKDGLCAMDCPFAIIRLDGDGFPEMVPGGDGVCTRCGHCVAVCPHGALDHAEVPAEQSPEIRKDLAVNADQAVQFLRSRRSIRVYADRPVERETVEKLVRIARYAPTAGNAQEVEWTVFNNRDVLRNIAGLTVDWAKHLVKTQPAGSYPPYLPLLGAAWDAGLDTILRGAPALVIASAPKEANNGMVDCAIALSYLELAAVAHGLGTCWAGMVHAALKYWPPLQEVVGLPKGHTNQYPMMLGYPKAKYRRLPERRAPKIHWR